MDDSTKNPEKKEISSETKSLEKGVKALEKEDNRCENQYKNDCNKVNKADTNINETLTTSTSDQRNNSEEIDKKVETLEENNEAIENKPFKEVFDRKNYDRQDLLFNLSKQNEFNPKKPYDQFNKPGDCVNRLFKGAADRSFGMFKENNIDKENVPILSEKEIFQNDNVTINQACYMYNWHKNKNEKLVIAVRGETDGWVWMMFSKPISEKSKFQILFYREFILEKEKNNGKWVITLGHEGEIKSSTSGSDAIQIDKDKDFENFFKDFKQWKINADFQNLCSVVSCLDNNWRSLNLYWKPDNNSEKNLMQLSSNSEDQIIRWNKKKEQIYSGENRKRIYWNGKWYSNLGGYKNKPLIKLEAKNFSKIKGEWKNLYNMCEWSDNEFYKKFPNPGEPEFTYCLFKFIDSREKKNS